MTDVVRTNARLACYWLMVATFLYVNAWIMSAGGNRDADWFYSSKFVIDYINYPNRGMGQYWYALLVPTVLVGTIALLFVTDAPLPVTRTSYLLRPFQYVLKVGKNQSNQWGMGDHGFYAFFIFFIALPALCYLVVNVGFYALPKNSQHSSKYSALELVSFYFGLAGSVAMSFFLIPVSRHNVLLAAVGWSPFHALKLHILSGYLAYGGILIHGFSYLAYLGSNKDIKTAEVIVPKAKCWVWKPSDELYAECRNSWWNLTGLIALFFMTALILTSLNWFRRRYYRIFYICHVSFGALTLIFAIMHWGFLVIWIMPSLLYYIASTMPVLVQAAASRFRGGVKVTEVLAVPNAGGCVEVKFGSSPANNALLDKEACMVVRMCVPSISLVWHPFTVFKHPRDPTTMRFLMRPSGTFTNELAARLVQDPKPIMILDGLYRGGDRISEALSHDAVSIVCGGVALTPFMSMIPCVIDAAKRLDAKTCTLRKFVVHWACREDGLSNFVVQNYFKTFQEMADDLEHVEVKLIVYHTSGKKEVTTTTTAAPLPKAAKKEPFEVTDYSQSLSVVANQSNNGSSDTNSEEVSQEEGATAGHKSASPTDVPGHDMEPARFMAAIHSTFTSNLTQCYFMSLILWIGFAIYTYYANNSGDFEILPWLANTWSTIVYLVAAVALSMVFEFYFLWAQKRFPPKPETYVVKEYNDAESGHANHSSNKTAATIEHVYARPTSRAVFDDLEDASCPAIFYCGPKGLTSIVTDEAHMINSRLGRTRFALYDEPFDM